MIYITKVILKNFQSHEYSELEFTQGLNVILGQSDSGKTAIIRGIKWALYNEPKGDFFVREGEKETSVEIFFSNNVILKRIRLSTKNIYELTDSFGRLQRFESFGNTVPPQIYEEIQIRSYTNFTYSKSMLNIAEQLDGPFLIQDSPYERAKAIGKLNDVDILDTAYSDLKSDLLSLNSELKNKINLRDEAQAELDSLNFLEDYEKRLENLKKIKETFLKNNDFLLKLRDYKCQAENIEGELKKERDIINKFKKLEDANTIFTEALNKKAKLKELINLKNDFIYNSKEIEKNKEILKKLENLEFIKDTNDKSKKINQLFLNLLSLKNQILNLERTIDLTKEKIKSLENLEKTKIILNDLENKNKGFNDFLEIKKRLNVLNEKFKIADKFLKGYENLDESFNLFKKLEKSLYNYNKLIQINENLSKIGIDIGIEKLKIDFISQDYQKNLEEYRKIYNKLDFCPFCFSKIDENTKNHIENHLRGEI